MLSTPIPQKQRISRAIFLLITVAAIFGLLFKSVNVYNSAPLGAIFELSWLPSLLILFVLPLIAMKFWFDEKFKLRSFNLYAIVVAGIALTVIFLT